MRKEEQSQQPSRIDNKKNIADIYKNILCNLTTVFCVTLGYYFKVYCEPYVSKHVACLIIGGGLCTILILMAILYQKLKHL